MDLWSPAGGGWGTCAVRRSGGGLGEACARGGKPTGGAGGFREGTISAHLQFWCGAIRHGKLQQSQALGSLWTIGCVKLWWAKF